MYMGHYLRIGGGNTVYHGNGVMILQDGSIYEG